MDPDNLNKMADAARTERIPGLNIPQSISHINMYNFPYGNTQFQNQPQMPSFFSTDCGRETSFPRTQVGSLQQLHTEKGQNLSVKRHIQDLSTDSRQIDVSKPENLVQNTSESSCGGSKTCFPVAEGSNTSDIPVTLDRVTTSEGCGLGNTSQSVSSGAKTGEIVGIQKPYYGSDYRHICNESSKVFDGYGENKFICGCCLERFSTICLLHKHLNTYHDFCGSYFFDEKTKTAYPKLGTVCSSTQTEDVEWLYNSSRNENIEKEEEKETDKSNRTNSVPNSRKLKKKPVTRGRKTRSMTCKTKGKVEDHQKGKPKVGKNTGRGNKNISSVCEPDVDKAEAENEVCVKVEINDNENTSGDGGNVAVASDTSYDTDDYDIDTFKELKSKERKGMKKHGKFKFQRQAKSFSEFYIRSDNMFKCKLCESMFEGYRKFRYHYKKAHVDGISLDKKNPRSSRRKPMDCKWCGQFFPSSKLCNDHMRVCSANQKLKCQICQTHFSTVEEVNSHILTHSDMGEMSCKHCTKAFTNVVFFHNHLLRHADVKSMQCEHCGKSVNGGRALVGHLQHCSEDRNLPCPVCNQMFKTKQALKYHMAIHSDERPFVCHICGYAGIVLLFTGFIVCWKLG